jgi:hypothetical protein
MPDSPQRGESEATTSTQKQDTKKLSPFFEGEATSSANYATTLDNLGTLDLTFGRLTTAEASLKRTLTMRLQLGHPANVARTQQHLGT